MAKTEDKRKMAKKGTPAFTPSPAGPLVLVGLMGAGKSKIGRLLADALDGRFTDNDTEVEKAARMTIAEIFEAYGEEKFRNLEADVLRRVLSDDNDNNENKPRHVIAVGGGAFMHDRSRALIMEKATAIWLRARPETLAARISDPSTRPMLKDGDPETVLTQLAETRNPAYANAHITVDTDGLSPDATLARLRAALDGYAGN